MVAGHLLNPAIAGCGVKTFSSASIGSSRKEPLKSRPVTGQPKVPVPSSGKRIGHLLERVPFLVNHRSSVSSSAAVSFPLGDFGKEYSNNGQDGRGERPRQKNDIILTKTVQENLVDGESKTDAGGVTSNNMIAVENTVAAGHTSPYGIVSAAIVQDVRFIMTKSLGSVRDEAGIALAGKLNREVKRLQERWASGFGRDSLSDARAVNSGQEGEEEEGKVMPSGSNSQGSFSAFHNTEVVIASTGEEVVVPALGPSDAPVLEGGGHSVNGNANGVALAEAMEDANASVSASVEIRKSLDTIMEDLRKRRQESERLWVQEREGVNAMLDGMWSELDSLQTLLHLLEEEMVTSGPSTNEAQSAPLVLNEIGTLPLAALTYPGVVTRLQSTGGTVRPGDASAVAVPNTDARPLASPKGPRPPKIASTNAAEGLQKKGSWHEWAAAAGLGAYALAGGVALYAWRAQLPSLTRGSPPTPVTAVTTAQSMQTPSRSLSPLLREARPGILELNADNFYDMLYRRPTFVMFYAPWCPYCQRLEGTWKDMAVALSEQGYNVQVAQVNAWKYPQFADAFQVPGFPTLILFNGVQAVGVHRGPRDLESLLSFVDLKMV